MRGRKKAVMTRYCPICFKLDDPPGDPTDSIAAGFQYAFPRPGHLVPSRETVRNAVGYRLEDAYAILTGDDDLRLPEQSMTVPAA